MRKLISLGIAIVILLFTVAGCAKEEKEDNTSVPQETNAQQTEKTDGKDETQDDTDLKQETLDITWLGFNHQGVLPKDGSYIQTKLEEMYNIKITNVPVDVYNSDQYNLLLATGVEFDVWTYANKTVDQAYDTGLIRELPIEMIQKYGPEFISIFEETSSTWTSLSTVDGKLYGIPMYSASFGCPIGLSVRTDWMEAVGATEVPNTLEEMEELLIKFRNEDPDGNGEKDTYALGRFANGSDFYFINPYVFASYGVMTHHWNVADDGTPEHWAIQDNYKQALAVLSRWYDEGIYDPETVTDDRNKYVEKFADGKIAGCFGTDWILEPQFAGTGWTTLADKNPDMDKDTMFTHIPPVENASGEKLTYAYNMKMAGKPQIYFGKDASDDKVARILTMFNDILLNEDLYLLIYYGEEGEHYSFDENGFVVANPEYDTKEELTDIGTFRYFNHQFMPEKYLKLSYGEVRYRSFSTLSTYDVLPIHPADSFMTEVELEYKAALDTIQAEFFWKVFTGEIDLESEWDGYVEKWLAAGGEELIQQKKALAEEMNLNVN